MRGAGTPITASVRAVKSAKSCTRLENTVVATIAPGRRAAVCRGAQRDVGVTGCGGLVLVAREQLQGDQEEEQSSGARQGRQRDVQVGQDALSEEREGGDHDEGHRDRLPGP
jgi:hypothetical protein